MSAGNYLTDEDALIIQQMIDASLLHLQNPGGGTPTPGDPVRNPETFVAKLGPDVEIEGLDDSVDPPVIHSGLCEVFHVFEAEDDDEVTPFLFREEPVTKKVYNLSGAALDDPDLHFLITRDKWGRFFHVGGGTCAGRNERWGIYPIGPPTGGDFKFITKVKGVTEDVEFAYNASNATVLAAFEAHAEIGAGNVAITGGPLPTTSIQVEFKVDLKNGLVPVPFTDLAGLDGTSIGCDVIRLERGMPADFTEAPPP